MIGRLRGIVAEVGEEETLIDVAGVGYVVRCGARTLSRLPAIGDEALLHVETQWSDQTGITLYGFLTRDDRRAYLALRTIQGVGPKAALSVLDVLPPGELASAGAREDKAAVARAGGGRPEARQAHRHRAKEHAADRPHRGFFPAAVAGPGRRAGQGLGR